MEQTPKFAATEAGVRSNYLAVLDRVQKAAQRSARDPSEIQLIGVTKYVDARIARWLVQFGCDRLAESRPQSLWEKAEALSDLPIEWHFIGHLQRNKAKRTLPLISTMHSVDSARILAQIQQDISQRQTPLQLLLEVNVSGDTDKTGMLVSEGQSLLEGWVKIAKQFPLLEIVGLMGMASLHGGTSQAQRDFEALRILRDSWENQFSIRLKELSMGMSEDFEIAIEQGATMIRVGSILFKE